MEYETYEEGIFKCLLSIADSLSVIASSVKPKTETKKTVAKKFEKPTVEQVREFCIKHGYQVDADQFVSFYESKGWLVGKSPMKDWEAAVRTWTKSRKDRDGGLFQPEEKTWPNGIRPQG